MSLDMIVYAPGAGGNHLKNLLCLTGKFANSSDLDTSIYDFKDQLHANGEVWMKGGRNLQEIFFDAMDQNPNDPWILPAHFGELQQFRSRLDRITSKRIIIITINQERDRRLLDTRQLRLGQAIHPYWLDEELIWIYQPDTLERFFGIPIENCLCLPLSKFWDRNFVNNGEIRSIEEFLGVAVSRESAHDLHHKWMQANFGPIDQNQNL